MPSAGDDDFLSYEENAGRKESTVRSADQYDNRDVAAFADILFVAVKPQFYAEVLEEIKDLLTEEQILVSIAPGKTLVWFDEVLGRNLKVIRTMPNTPSMVKKA